MRFDESSDPVLDELLHAARWPEPDAGQLARLEDYWRAIQRRRRSARRAKATAALLITASFLLGFVVWNGRMYHVGPPQPAVPTVPEQHVTIIEAPHVEPDSGATDRDSQPPQELPQETPQLARQPVREANVYEQTVMLVHRRRRSRSPGHVPSDDDPIARAVATVVAEENGDILPVARELVAQTPDGEQRLAQKLIQTGGAERAAAARLLCSLATRRSLPLLVECSRRPDCAVEVEHAIERLATAEELLALAREERSSDRQRAWIAAALGDGSAVPVRRFLELVEDRVTSQAALAALHEVSQPPVEALFAELDSNRIATRMAAARALGELSDPAISQRLVRIVMLEPASRREALVGLLTSSDAVATEFLALASRHAVLGASIRALGARRVVNQVN